VHPVRKPWWQQATALVTVTTGGVITGFNFVPGATATMTSPTSVPLHLLALEQAGHPGAAMDARAVGGNSADSVTSDALLRSAIVNVAKYYLQLAKSRTPAQMETLIWDNTSLDGADHGPSCAAFASLTLELAARAVGQQSWVTGGTNYPWPMPAWADVRVDPNPASPGVTSMVQDAQAHGRWHPIGDGYQPRPGDWVLFDEHVEVVTGYSDGVLDTIGADSSPDLTVNAHAFSGPLDAAGVTGFIDNGHLTAASAGVAAPGPTAAANKQPTTENQSRTDKQPAPGKAASGKTADGQAGDGRARGGQGGGQASAGAAGRAVIPGLGRPAGPGITAGTGTGPGGAGDTGSGARSVTETARNQGGAAAIPGAAPAASATSGAGAIPGASPGTTQPVAKPPAAPAATPTATPTATPATTPATTPVTTPAATPSTTPASKPERYKKYATPELATPGTRVQQAFISLIAPGAMAAQQRYGVPAAVTIAQAIDESAWGNSQLASSDHNLFGIKGSGPAGSVTLPTSEYFNGQWVTINAQFRVYHNVAESISDHAELLATSGYYQRAMADSGVPDAFANDLTGVYATDPEYGANIIALMKLYNLYRFDGPTQPAQTPATTQPTATQPTATQPTAPQPSATQPSAPSATQPTATPPTASPSGADHARGSQVAAASQAQVPGLASPTLTPPSAPGPGPAPTAAPTSAPASRPTASPGAASGAIIPGVAEPGTSPANTVPPNTVPPNTAAPATDHQTTAHQAARVHAATPGAHIPGLIAPNTPIANTVVANTATANAAFPNTAAANTSLANTSTPATTHQAATHTDAPTPGTHIPGLIAPNTPIANTAVANTAVANTVPANTGAAATAYKTTASVDAVTHIPRMFAPNAAFRDTVTARQAAVSVDAVTAGAHIPGVLAPNAAVPAAATTRATAARYRPQLPHAVTTAYFATAKGSLGHGEHLYRDVAAQTGIRWELLAACDWMQCKAHPRYSPVHGEKIGTLNSDGTSYPTKSAALAQCASDLVELTAAVYGIDLTARRVLSVRALADAFAAFRWGGLLRRRRVSAMEFPYSVAGLTAQHMKMHWPVIDDPDAPDRPGAKFREPFGAVPVVLSLGYPATVLAKRKRR